MQPFASYPPNSSSEITTGATWAAYAKMIRARADADVERQERLIATVERLCEAIENLCSGS